MKPWTRSFHRSKTSKADLDKKLQQNFVHLKALSDDFEGTKKSLETAGRVTARDRRDLVTFQEDMRAILERKCVDLKSYLNYKQSIAETQRKIDTNESNINKLTAKLSSIQRQLVEAKRLGDVIVAELATFGRIIPIWHK